MAAAIECGYLSDGYIVPLDALQQCSGDAMGLLRRRLTVVRKPAIGPEQRTELWEVRRYGGRPYAVVPRLWLQSLVYSQGLISRPHILFPPMQRTEGVRFTGELTENQQIVVDHLLSVHLTPENIANGTAAALFNMRAGLGKTFIAAALVASLRLRTLYVTMRSNLRVQAFGDFAQVLECKYGEFTPGKDTGNDIDVAIINTASAITPADMARYSMVIYDEVHAYCSESWRRVFRRTMTWVNIGMSATTHDRDDGLDVVYHKELALRGEIVTEDLPGFNAEDANFYIDVDVVNYWGPPEYTEARCHPSTGKVFTPWLQKLLINDPDRMALVCRYLGELYGQTDADGRPLHNIYVFCEERDQLDLTYAKLAEYCERVGIVLCAPEISKYVGGTKKAGIEYAIAHCRVFLTTYGYSAAGVSIAKMSAMIFVTPRKAQMKQIIGRICRLSGDPTVRRRIVDIVDKGTPLAKQYRHRLAAYKTKDKPVLDADGKPTGESYLNIRVV